MKEIIAVLVGAATGIISGFGIGGGSILMLYLTVFADMPQFKAGGLNLMYFTACAPMALYSHIKNGLIEWKAVIYGVAAGIPASVAAALLAAKINTDWLRRAFGVFLLYVGAKELLTKRKDNDKVKAKSKPKPAA